LPEGFDWRILCAMTGISEAVRGASAEAPSAAFLAMRRELLAPPADPGRGGDGPPGLMPEYTAWLRGRGCPRSNPAIHRLVHGLPHERLDLLGWEEVRAAVSWPAADVGERHALGAVRGVGEHRWVEDFDTPWTFAYQLHGLMESLGRVPWWPDYRDWLRGPGRGTYLGPATAAFRAREPRADADRRRSFADALRWRVGCGYYSFLRELHLYTSLRVRHGLPMRYHVFADAQLRVDMWCGPTLVSVYVENARFRAGEEGRKRLLRRVCGGGGFRFCEVRLPRAVVFGRPHLVPEAEIARVARELRANLESGGRPAGETARPAALPRLPAAA